MIYKKKLYLFFLCIPLSLFLIIMSLYIYDPLQLYHKSWGRKLTVQKNMRQQAAGIINNYQFDSIILGTSMLENTSANEASNMLEGSFINISIAGSDFFERSIILKYLFKKKCIKKVIYSLDMVYINQRKGTKDYKVFSFNYLYNMNNYDDIKAYINNKTLICMCTTPFSSKCIGKQTTFDRPTAWFAQKNSSIRFGGLNHWFSAKNNHAIKNTLNTIIDTSVKIKSKQKKSLESIDIKIKAAKKYIDNYIIDFAKKHPKTQFLFVFPPYSRIRYAQWAQYDLPSFEIHKAILRYMAKASDKFANIKTYAFGDQSFLDDISYYMDMLHYHYSINSWMLEQMGKNRNELHITNVEPYIKIITQKALDYDLVTLGNKIANYLQANQPK